MFSDNALVKPVKGKVKIKVEPDDSNEPHIQLEAIDENKALMEEVEKVQTEFKSVKSENNHLTAVVDQLRKGIDQTETIDQQKSDDENSNNNSFEVEQLIKYRKKNRKPQFLVRWADSWVDEKNLNCRELLQNYYATKNLK